MALQGLSRGSCRVVDNGYARPMTAWFIHRDVHLRKRLEPVMPGAVWRVWKPEFGDQDQGVIASAAAKIVEYLETLPQETTKVSTQVVRKAVPEVTKMTLTHAVRLVPEMIAWMQSGRGLERMF